VKILRCQNCGGDVHSEDLASAECLYCGTSETLVPVDQILDMGLPKVIPAQHDEAACRKVLSQPALVKHGQTTLLVTPFWMLEGVYRYAYYSVGEFEHGFGASEEKRRVAVEQPATTCVVASSALSLDLDPLVETDWTREGFEQAAECKNWEGTRLNPNRTLDEAQERVSFLMEAAALEEIHQEACAIEMYRGRYEVQGYQLYYRPLYLFRHDGLQTLVDAVTCKEVGTGARDGSFSPLLPRREGPCPGCGAPVERRDGVFAITCASCETEVLMHDRALEAVPRHGLVAKRISVQKVVSEFPGGSEWKLKYLPFWSLQGRFATDYLAHRYEENLVRGKFHRDRSELVDDGVCVLVPAGSFSEFGVTWEAATSTPSVEFPQLCFQEGAGDFQEDQIESEADFEYGTLPLEEAKETATEVMNWTQRDQLHASYESLEIMGSEAKVSEASLLHVPVYVGREADTGRALAVEAFGGRSLRFQPAMKAVNHKPKKGLFYARLFAVAALSVGGNVAAGHWLSDGSMWAVLWSLLPQLLALQLFIFVVKDPRSILEVEKSGSISIFDPLLAFRTNRQGLKGLLVYVYIALASSFAPVLILLSPLVLVGYPFARAVYGRFVQEKSFWKVLKHEVWQTVLFCIRTGSLALVGGILIWGFLWSIWTGFQHAFAA
jgi:DNA-directed RNA polymerase subunit RPC12/RpoP